MRAILTKGYSRDFTLPLIQAWCRGETTNKRQWTKKMQPIVPYQIFIRHDGLVNCYVDERGIVWIKDELKSLMNKPDYISTVVKIYRNCGSKIQKIFEAEKPLPRKALIQFIQQLEETWPWHEANWFLMEILHEVKHKDFALANQARIDLEKMVPGSDMVIRKSLRKIYPKLGRYSSELMLEEIILNKLPSIAELKARDQKYSFADARLFVEKTEEDMEKIFNVKIESELKQKISKFKGQIAFKGIARGKVRLVMSRAQVSKLQQDEILVSAMTMPDFVPAMKKAAGIITDEGGITCHAAIVARELKKPCIIGTKIATSILKDGDMVEVDANKGVIKIL